MEVREGELLLKYDGEDDGVQSLEYERDVTPRICMPWHPRYLKGDFSIMLRRNVGHGKLIEGLEVRWGLVVRVLQALTRLGFWRGDFWF